MRPSREHDHTIADRGGLGVVGDHHDGLVERVDRLAQQPQHLRARGAVEVAGRLVREHDGRTGDEGAGDGDTLLLATRKLRWPVGAAIIEADGVDQMVDPRAVDVAAGDRQGQDDVLLGRQHGQEVERLEDEPDLLPPQLGQIVVVERCYLGAVDRDRSGGGPVEPREAVHQRRLARAGRAHDRAELAAAERDRHACEGVHGGLPLAVPALQFARCDDVAVGGAHRRVRVAQRPRQAGLRFSPKACTPSRKSSVLKEDRRRSIDRLLLAGIEPAEAQQARR